MPLLDMPSPAPWVSWLPSEYSSIPGARELWDEGLRANAGSSLLDMSGVVADLWGVDLLSEATGLLEALEAPVVAWIDDAAAAALGALGLGASVIPVVGWIVSGIAAVVSAIIAAVGGQRSPAPSPIEWSPPVYRQAVDQDAVRSLLRLSDKTDWQSAMAAPTGYQVKRAPSPTDVTEPLGGTLTPMGGGVLQPGGLADWGWYGWRPPPSGGSTRPGAWQSGDTVHIRAPSVGATQRELWAALLGTTGIVWAVDTVQLVKDWRRAGSALVTAARPSAQTMGLSGPYLERDRGPWILAVDASDAVRRAWRGRPCLVETLPSGKPVPDAAPVWKGGATPHARPSDLAGYQESLKRHAWLPRTASQAVVALEALGARQSELARSQVAAWALPTQPGARQHWPAIEATRVKILSSPHKVEAPRIRDDEYRLAVVDAQRDRPLGGAVSAGPSFDPVSDPDLDDVLPGSRVGAGGGGGALVLGALAMALSRRRR